LRRGRLTVVGDDRRLAGGGRRDQKQKGTMEPGSERYIEDLETRFSKRIKVERIGRDEKKDAGLQLAWMMDDAVD